MKPRIFALALVSAAIAGWLVFDFVSDRAPPHRFLVRLDEDASKVELALGNADGNDVIVMKGGPRHYFASPHISDASGHIRIVWANKTETNCVIGYITNGEREPHVVSVIKRVCPPIGSNV
ncbi:hypothetical protein [uncultured Sphingorhabdus sp.]|uniref:hypothetical protein n=1 Tax=uncultured Sphingorhabdus sp. TaxID=1686106 RepID=UPI002629E4CF|nr:hypothetical protein [uncultured Sphingorhabdus sp.]HMS21166.1 hypothetical protein [Sphingorhabdus sp.]